MRQRISEIINSATINEPSPVDGFTRISIERRPGQDESGHTFRPSYFQLWFEGEQNEVNELFGLMTKQLSAGDHRSHPDFTFVVLYLCCVLNGGRGIRQSDLDKVQVTDADANQFYVSRLKLPEDWRFQIPPFRLGPVDVQKIMYQADKARSDFGARYGQALTGHYGIWRPAVRIKVVDIWTLINQQRLSSTEADQSPLTSICDHYFQTLTSVLFSDFWEALEVRQNVLVAAGAPRLQIENLKGTLGLQQITIVLNGGSQKLGYVSAQGVGLSLDWANAHVRIPKIQALLREEYQFEEFDSRESHNLLRRYAEFLTRAKRHFAENRPDEAFLHFVIGLDLVFGVKQQLSAKVGNRTAALVHRHFGRSFVEQEKRLRRLYDVRSRYVHQGSSVAPHEVAEIEEICSEVLQCLFRYQKIAPPGETIESWLLEIDFVVASLQASRPPQLIDLVKIGVEAARPAMATCDGPSLSAGSSQSPVPLESDQNS